MAQKNGKNTLTPVRNLYLTGFMCAGKTSVGRLLAESMGLPFRDSDALIEKGTGTTVRALVAAGGLAAFRKLEAAAVKKLAAGGGQVISLGGGVYPSRKWRGLLGKTGVTIFLHCPWPELERRLKAAAGPRPLLAGPWERASLRAQKLYRRRLPFYRAADVTVTTSGLTPARAAAEIKKRIGKLQP